MLKQPICSCNLPKHFPHSHHSQPRHLRHEEVQHPLLCRGVLVPPHDPAPACASLIEVTANLQVFTSSSKCVSAFPHLSPTPHLHFLGEAFLGDGEVLKEKCFEGKTPWGCLEEDKGHLTLSLISVLPRSGCHTSVVS